MAADLFETRYRRTWVLLILLSVIASSRPLWILKEDRTIYPMVLQEIEKGEKNEGSMESILALPVNKVHMLGILPPTTTILTTTSRFLSSPQLQHIYLQFPIML